MRPAHPTAGVSPAPLAAWVWLFGSIGSILPGCGREARPSAAGGEVASAARLGTTVKAPSSENTGPSSDGASDDHRSDPENQARPPAASPDLDEHAAHLLEAVATNDPPTADDFFFPRAPFIPLKDVGDPARYFDQLLAAYHRDIRTLHAQQKDWSGAESMRLLAMNCGEIQRVRMASSTFG